MVQKGHVSSSWVQVVDLLQAAPWMVRDDDHRHLEDVPSAPEFVAAVDFKEMCRIRFMISY